MHDARDRNQGIWIEPSDRLYVAAYSSVASLVVMVSGYFRKTDGDIVEYAATVNPTSDRAVTAVTQHFGAGFLLSCVASLASGNANRGQCYVRAQIQRSTGAPTIKLHNVIGGYVTDDYSPSFPYGYIEGPLDGQGMLRSVQGSDPAAGAEFSETVPTGARWRVSHIMVTLVTDGTAANRQVTLIIDDGTSGLTRSQLGLAMGATLTSPAIFGNWGFTTTGNSQAFVMPAILPITLPAAARIRTATLLLQAGDNFGPPQFLVEEWIEA